MKLNITNECKRSDLKYTAEKNAKLASGTVVTAVLAISMEYVVWYSHFVNHI